MSAPYVDDQYCRLALVSSRSFRTISPRFEVEVTAQFVLAKILEENTPDYLRQSRGVLRDTKKASTLLSFQSDGCAMRPMSSPWHLPCMHRS